MISIRRLKRGESDLYKEIRLRSLKESPAAFATPYQSALERTPESWVEQADSTAEGVDRATFIAFAHDDPIGITALYRDGDRPDMGEILQVWITPEFRSKGVALDLMNVVFQWAAENRFNRILATITSGNTRALKFYEKYGFIRFEEDSLTGTDDPVLVRDVSVDPRILQDDGSEVKPGRNKLDRNTDDPRRAYFDAEPWYQREKSLDWYQQMALTNDAVKSLLTAILESSSAVLEVACGGGWIGEYILSQTVNSYTGFDFAETAVSNAVSRLVRYENAAVSRANALDPDNYTDPVDIIVAHQFIHCLIGDDRKTWLKLCYRSLKDKQGTLLLSSMIGIPEQISNTIDPVTKTNAPRNRYYAEDDEIRKELHDTGFVITRMLYPENYSGIYLAKVMENDETLPPKN